MSFYFNFKGEWLPLNEPDTINGVSVSDISVSSDNEVLEQNEFALIMHEDTRYLVHKSCLQWKGD